LFFDVNIITKKVNEKKPLERLINRKNYKVRLLPHYFYSVQILHPSIGKKKGLPPSQRQALPFFSSFRYLQ